MSGYILFLGSGTEQGTPNLEHVFKNIDNANKGNDPFCEICQESIKMKSKNVRNPFSIVIKNPVNNLLSSENKHHDTFLFEIGSTFRISMLEYAIPANINRVDAIFCMSSNELSFNGIDETREVQKYERPVSNDGIVFYEPKIRVPIYFTSSAIHKFNDWYNYIIEYSLKDDLKSKTKVGCVQINILDPRNSPNVILIDSISKFNDYISLNKDIEIISSVDNDLTLNPIIIQYSNEIKITSLFFIDSDNKLCSGYCIEYSRGKKLICIIPTYSIIPKETLSFLKTTPAITTLIFPIVPNNSIPINSESIKDSIDFCAKMINAENIFFYNIDCNYSHDFIQEIVDEKSIKFHNLKFTVSFDSQLIPIIHS
ncbi:uncharacterized protein ELE39_002211 [Cryptosporidium sp. chipmunk genotype I]|uniref:uncharacterized protein n=1 Tax=Cryptosporidium sp. chipmunk genotype I TaxID=1280935 RepID=UPI003519F2F8|nr:hypothetical protein ELE39_002211 [Cryptosporidium sp. chipmunk genotype I]